jgi:tetratricopeptide (TPR) repeat protein
MKASKYKVFISYKRKTGEDFALHLKEGLESEHIPAFLDTADIPKACRGTEEWQKIRDQAISYSEVFLLIITDGIETSSEVAQEIAYAIKQNKKCMFLRHKGLCPEIHINIEDKRVNLGRYNQIEFETKEDLLRKVLRNLRETPRINKFQKEAIPLISKIGLVKSFADHAIEELRKKAVSTEEIIGSLEDHEIDYLRGRWFSRNEKFDKALSLYDRALNSKPSFLPALIEKSIVLGLTGKYEEAVSCLDKSLEIKPTALAWAVKGTLLDSLGKYEQAVICYNKSLEIEPLGPVYYNKGVALDALERYKEAIECYDKAIKMNPEDSSSWHNKGYALFRLGRYPETIDCCNRSLQIRSNALSLGLKGHALMYVGKMEEAKQCYIKALRMDNRNSAILLGFSKLLLVLGDVKEGLKTAKQALDLSKDDLDVIVSRFLCATAYYLMGEKKKAENEINILIAYLKDRKPAKIEKREFSFVYLAVKDRLDKKSKSKLSSVIYLLK